MHTSMLETETACLPTKLHSITAYKTTISAISDQGLSSSCCRFSSLWFLCDLHSTLTICLLITNIHQNVLFELNALLPDVPVAWSATLLKHLHHITETFSCLHLDYASISSCNQELVDSNKTMHFIYQFTPGNIYEQANTARAGTWCHLNVAEKTGRVSDSWMTGVLF
jgi:hypothetical protein